jgi:DNA-3-methyladenine glycosylase
MPREVLAQPTLAAARALVGAYLLRDALDAVPRRVGRIVEVEAYIGEDDRASHARFGRTARNSVMYGPPGVAYVYLVYGMYDCLNVVTEPEGRAAAVLIRAVEPVEGVDAMRAARVRHAAARARTGDDRAAISDRLTSLPAARLAAGPGLVAAAFDITRAETGLDLLDPRSSLRLAAGEPPLRVEATPRIGIDYAAEPWRSQPWRFVDPASPARSR